MMRRRLLLALGLALAGLAVAGAVWWLALPRPGITAANCARIKAGMRRQQVQEILGGPPTSSLTGMVLVARAGRLDRLDNETMCKWQGDEGSAEVWFYSDGTVIGDMRTTDGMVLPDAGFFPTAGPTLLQRLLSSLRRLFP